MSKANRKVIRGDDVVSPATSFKPALTYHQLITNTDQKLTAFCQEFWEAEGDVLMSTAREISALMWEFHWLKRSLEEDD